MLPLHSRFLYTITSWHGNVFRVSDPLQAHWWIPQGHKEPVKRSLVFSLLAWTRFSVNKRPSCQLFDVIVIWTSLFDDVTFHLAWPCVALFTDMWSTFCCRMSVLSIAKSNSRFYQTLKSTREPIQFSWVWVYMYVVVNFDALAQASDIRI